MRFSALAVGCVGLLLGAAYFLAGAKASGARWENRARAEAPSAVAVQDVLADESDRELVRKYLEMPVLSDQEHGALVRAAGRRYMRRKVSYTDAEQQVGGGKLDSAALDGLRREMELARKVCDVAEGLGQRQEMAAAAQANWELEVRLANMPSMKGLAERYNGATSFTEADLETLEETFSRVYHRKLPVSTRGDSPLHRSMGFDHRGRFDVAVNPSAPEGVWLRQYLVGKGVPFLAFRGAVRGQATGAHVHIGPPSTRAAKE